MKRGRENGRYAWGTIKIQAFLTQTLRAAAKSTFVYLQFCAFFILWLLLSKRWRLLVQTTTNITFLKFLPLAKRTHRGIKSHLKWQVPATFENQTNYWISVHQRQVEKIFRSDVIRTVLLVLNVLKIRYENTHISSERYVNFRELVLWSFIRNLHAVI
jgi:hypothetical protein